MQAGQLRSRLLFTKPVVVGQGSFGQDIIENQEVGSFWCRIEYYEGREFTGGMQRVSDARYLITLRHQPKIVFDRTMQIWWGCPARIFDIVDVQDQRLSSSPRPQIRVFAKDHQV